MLTVINPIVVGGGVAIVMFLALLAALAAGRRLGKRSIWSRARCIRRRSSTSC